MRCKSCDYPLWTIRARVCPECGSPFAPSDFEYTRNSVRFGCPHCDQSYFGTDERGHLTPRSFECVGCRRRIDMDEMVLLPREGVHERQTQVYHLPWSDKERGFFSRFFGMIGWGMGRPGDIGRALPQTMTTTSALGYSMLINIVGKALGIGSIVVLFTIMMMAGSQGGAAPLMGGVFLFSMLAVFGIAVLGWLVGVLLWGVLTHWFIGGVRREHVTVGRTIQVICLTSGPMILTAVPCLGYYGLQYAGLVWWMIAASIALRPLHGCSGARAAVATIAPPLIALAVVIGLIVAWFYFIINTATMATARSGAMWAGIDQARANSVGNAITAEVSLLGGSYPSHGVEMLRHGTLTETDLFTSTNMVDSISARVIDVPLSRFQFEQQAVDDAVASLPAGVLAHRVGDVVFTWHGFTPATDGDLWVAVMAPPTGSGGATSGGSWWVIEADGDVTEVTTARRPSDLGAQNRLRAGHGLPALPDLETVTDHYPRFP